MEHFEKFYYIHDAAAPTLMARQAAIGDSKFKEGIRMSTRPPDEFTHLLHKLLAASDELSAYCKMHGETELSQFFERQHPEGGPRCYVDERIAAANPNFMCHKNAAS